MFGSAILLSATVAVSEPMSTSADPVIYNPENPTEPITPENPEPLTTSSCEPSETVPSSAPPKDDTCTASTSEVATESTGDEETTMIVKKTKKRYINSEFFVNPINAATDWSKKGLGSGNDSFTDSHAAQTAYLLSGVILYGRKAI